MLDSGASLEMSGAFSPECSDADTQEPPGYSEQLEATSPLFDSEQEDGLPFDKDPQDCTKASFESSVEIDSVSAASGKCAFPPAKEENASPSIDHSSNDGEEEPHISDAEDVLDISFDEDKLRENFGITRKSASIPTQIHDLRASCRKKPMQNVRRNTDGGLAKFNLSNATAAASASINASKNLYSSGRNSLINFKQRSVNSLEAPSVELQTCFQRLRYRLFEFMNSNGFCSPLRRYSKTRSMIQVMDNQCLSLIHI